MLGFRLGFAVSGDPVLGDPAGFQTFSKPDSSCGSCLRGVWGFMGFRDYSHTLHGARARKGREKGREGERRGGREGRRERARKGRQGEKFLLDSMFSCFGPYGRARVGTQN